MNESRIWTMLPVEVHREAVEDLQVKRVLKGLEPWAAALTKLARIRLRGLWACPEAFFM